MVLIPLKFCRGQCKSRRFATETSLGEALRRKTGTAQSNETQSHIAR
jgi:hypothetical protein